ncbi:uncharacterized protein ColSpa_04908 [Colletotrichum spaethianum]|uniref:Uncharacterized protein n=1 Tax=Colletotrichum spaethianum TaxID=700344 RepID=A0AA37LIK6_9PEZI|nr:uncharacterized protein ColSpa_04908 [Colletotrichum spaethianum]GKT44727.1 hypothetical protein ColSpa_04908 [Colletotrichum spaethianum]
MGAHLPSAKAMCRGLLYVTVFALLFEVCQARGRDHKKRDSSSQALTTPITPDGTIFSLSASERKGERVVTSVITTYILVTLPCGVSELPSSPTHQPITISTLNSSETKRGTRNSLAQPWNTTAVSTDGASSLTNWNNTAGGSIVSTSIFNGITTAIGVGDSTTISPQNGSATRSGVTSNFTNANTTVASPVISVPLTSSSSKLDQDSQLTEGSQSTSKKNEPSTSAVQVSLSGGGTAQTSRVTTFPGQDMTSTTNTQSFGISGSTEAAGKSSSLSFTTAKDSTTTDLSHTIASGTSDIDRDIPTSSMPVSIYSGVSTQKPTIPATTKGDDEVSSKASEDSDPNENKPTKAPKDDDDRTSTRKSDDDNGIKSTTRTESNEEKSTMASSSITQLSGASSTNKASSTGQSVSPISTAESASSGTTGPSSTSSSRSSESEEYGTVFMTATIKPPPGIDVKTMVTWTSTEVTKTTTRNGIAWPTIFPVWFCGGGQLLCAPKCLIPFLSCGGIDIPGPLGFPWAKPPPKKPKGKPRKVRPDDPTDPEDPEDDPEPSETPTSTTSSETSCTASTTVSPHCDQHCFVRPVTTIGSLTSFTTTCNTATCKPTVVCSRTLDTTTTTTLTTQPATPTPVEHFCGDKESPCLNCGKSSQGKTLVARQHGFIPWNPAPDPELLNGPQGLTRPDTWPQGPQNWWDRMWKYVYHYCDGLTAPRLTLDGEKLEMGYSTMHADVFGDQALAGATGPFWGCSGIIIITKRGIYTSHVWEIPNFHKGTHKPTAFDWDAEFEEGLLQFLKRGSGDRIGGYKGIEQLKRDTPIFDNIVEDTLAVILHVPSAMTFAGSSQIPPNYGDFDPRHAGLVDQWTDFIAKDLGFPREKIRKNIYVKGPSYWPAYVEEKRPLNPMDMYQPPYGLLHWQYHPSHVVKTLPDGTEVRKPTIRVWYEKFLVFEESWCLPGAVATRDKNGSGSCPMPSAPARDSSVASGGSASASASASSGSGSINTSAIIIPGSSGNSIGSNGASTSMSTASPPVILPNTSSQQAVLSSSKGKATAWVTATAEVTVTSWKDPAPTTVAEIPSVMEGGPVISRVPLSEVSNPLPTPSYAPSKRIVRISQDMSFGDNKTNHTAVITVYEISGSKETILVSERLSKDGGPVDLPSRITVEDQYGGSLDVNFVRQIYQIEFESKRRGRIQKWSLMNIKDKNNLDNSYCNVRSVTPGEGVLKRSVDCFYNT